MGNNDVHGSLHGQRKSGRYSAFEVEILLNTAATAITTRGYIKTKQVLDSGSQQSFRLISCTYNGISYIALEQNSTGNFNTSFVWFNGHIRSTQEASIFLNLTNTDVTDILAFSNSDTLESVQCSTFHLSGNVGIGTTNPQSTIDVNGNIKINGSIINTFGRPMLKQIGGILQVVNAVKDPHTLGTQHDIDQITVNITPTSASSKFLVMVAIQGERGAGGITESYLNAHIYRSNSNLIMFAYGLFYNIAISARDCSSSTYLDSPATTSIITYSVRTLRVGPNGTFYVFTGATNITVMEVAG